MLDAENKRLAENLATKVSRLKSVSEDIGPAEDQQISDHIRAVEFIT